MINLKLLKRLGELFSFKTNEDVDEFLEIIGEIAKEIVETKEQGYLPFLFVFLQDDPEFIVVRDSVMRAIECYTDQIFVDYILENLKYYYEKIPDCLLMFFWVIFNTPDCLKILKQNIHLADKETLLKLLNNMEQDKYCPPEHKPIIAELRELINSHS